MNMRRRSVRRNPSTSIATAKPSVQPIQVGQTDLENLIYNRDHRNLNFFTDLLADKMDVIRRKAKMYGELGYADAAKSMHEVWRQLHKAFIGAQSKGVGIVMPNDKGGISPWDRTASVQIAMDNADKMMSMFGPIILKDLLDKQRSLSSEVQNCEDRCNALTRDIQSLQDSHSVDMLAKSDYISNLEEELNSSANSLLVAQNEKEACEAQIAALTDQVSALDSELTAIKEPVTLMSSALVTGGSSQPVSLNLSDRNAVLAELSQRDTMIERMAADLKDAKDLQSEIAKNGEKALQDALAAAAKEQQTVNAENTKIRNIAIGLGALLVIGGGVVYFSRK